MCCCWIGCPEEMCEVFQHKMKRDRMSCDGSRNNGSVVQERKGMDQGDWEENDREEEDWGSSSGGR